jgi:hypothetical protein
MLKISRANVSVGHCFRVPPHIVWDLLTDTHSWSQWGPSVKAVRCVERYIHKGSAGRVLTVFGLWLPFVVTEYEHLRYWRWKVAAVNATGHRIQASEKGTCRLWFDVPLAATPYTLICQIALKRIARLLDSANLINS